MQTIDIEDCPLFEPFKPDGMMFATSYTEGFALLFLCAKVESYGFFSRKKSTS
jgi:hypothetical protein